MLRRGMGKGSKGGGAGEGASPGTLGRNKVIIIPSSLSKWMNYILLSVDYQSMAPFQYMEVWISMGLVRAFRTSIYHPNANKRNTPGQYQFITPLSPLFLKLVVRPFQPVRSSTAEVQNFCAIEQGSRDHLQLLSMHTCERSTRTSIRSINKESIHARKEERNYVLVVQECIMLLRIEQF